MMEEMLWEIKASPVFSFQFDESIDVSLCSLVYVRYIHLEHIEKEFLFSKTPKTTTKGEDVMEMISSFFESNDLQWKSLCVCADGTPSILGSRSGFQPKVRTQAKKLLLLPSETWAKSAGLLGDIC
ncbi:DUF4371 domain-containing protein [Nephila pilipes]|uniref:DUF4371 domain-containing protein n=1 Tax=Nephila pilipes TaxID=299642 RepID=A0A8X6JQA5_NEPPI|nr:DUF4371 domain-containing protein [Nephila pilipes]